MSDTKTRTSKRTCALLLGLTLATGCASLTHVDCAAVDWYGVGMQDGRLGLTADRLAWHEQTCAGERGPHAQRYAEGREEGLRRYCTVDNGVRVGRAGETYLKVCPEGPEKDFLSGYYLGAISSGR